MRYELSSVGLETQRESSGWKSRMFPFSLQHEAGIISDEVLFLDQGVPLKSVKLLTPQHEALA